MECNGIRGIAYILADLLAIRESLPAFYFHRIKGKDFPALYRAVELAREGRDLTPLYEVIKRYNPAALANQNNQAAALCY